MVQQNKTNSLWFRTVDDQRSTVTAKPDGGHTVSHNAQLILEYGYDIGVIRRAADEFMPHAFSKCLRGFRYLLVKL